MDFTDEELDLLLSAVDSKIAKLQLNGRGKNKKLHDLSVKIYQEIIRRGEKETAPEVPVQEQPMKVTLLINKSELAKIVVKELNDSKLKNINLLQF